MEKTFSTLMIAVDLAAEGVVTTQQRIVAKLSLVERIWQKQNTTMNFVPGQSSEQEGLLTTFKDLAT